MKKTRKTTRKTIFNGFRTPLHTICANDGLRPQMNHVCFVGNYAYATDAHVLIKQSMDSWFMDKEMLHHLNGCSMPAKMFQFLYNKNIMVEQGRITLPTDYGTIQVPLKTMQENEIDSMWVQKMDNVLRGEPETTPDVAISLNPALLARIAVLFDNPVLTFFRNNKAAYITENSYDHKATSIGLIIPTMFDAEQITNALHK